MEHLSNILNIILASGIVSLLLFYRSKRRKHNAEADVSEFDAKVIEIKHFSEQLREAYTEIDRMQDIINSTRAHLMDISKALSECRLELIKEQERRAAAEYNLCSKSNCEQRTPPRKLS